MTNTSTPAEANKELGDIRFAAIEAVEVNWEQFKREAEQIPYADGPSLGINGFVRGAQWQASREQQWVPVLSSPPDNGSIVTAGHTVGWIEPDILFRDGHFYKRVNHLTGGDAGFKQKDWKKPDGNPASPDEWPWGPELFPTHYQPLPSPPQQS